MKNKMKEVCELLDIKFGENFNIKGSDSNPFYINDIGLYNGYGIIDSFNLRRLLTGEISIEKDILTDEERAYLASVIEPENIYKNVKFIRKYTSLDDYYIQIYIEVTETNTRDSICLPFFKKDKKMYTGMEVNKCYTLKELGLEKKTSIYDELSPLDELIIDGLAVTYNINIDTIAEIYITYDRNYERTKNILYSMNMLGL